MPRQANKLAGRQAGKQETFQAEAERRLEMLLRRTVENNGLWYLSRLAQNICENSDAWYWQGVCDGLNYTAPEFITVCKNMLLCMQRADKRGKQ